jgi:hypothetical protein
MAALRAPSELAGFWTQVVELDELIAECHSQGYAADVDLLLEERSRWQRERDELLEDARRGTAAS